MSKIIDIETITYCGNLAWRTNGDVYGVKCQITVGYTLGFNDEI